MVISTPVRVAAFALLCGLFLAPAAVGSRQATFKEREALTLALPASLQKEPVGCVWIAMRVSNNGRYADVRPEYLNATHQPCVQYAADGDWLLKKTGAGWRTVFNGSDLPSCTLQIPKDLVACLK